MMKKNILIKNGVVVDPIFKTQEQRDVYIQTTDWMRPGICMVLTRMRMVG